MIRSASCRKRIRRLGRNHVNLWHGDADLLREALNNGVRAGQLFPRNRLRPVHGQRNLVREEVGNEVHHCCNDQRQQHAILTAERTAQEHQQECQRCQQKCSLKGVPHNSQPH